MAGSTREKSTSMKTKTVAAVVHEKDAPFALEEVELDEPRPNEVLVHMVATGVCHTDLSVRSGVIPFPLPGIVGHEGAGVVEAIGSAVQRVKPGDHVLAAFTCVGYFRHRLGKWVSPRDGLCYFAAR
jgi:aryl-alcohol dehydrogenase